MHGPFDLETGQCWNWDANQLEARLTRYVLAHRPIRRQSRKSDRQFSYVDLRYPNGFAAR